MCDKLSLEEAIGQAEGLKRMYLCAGTFNEQKKVDVCCPAPEAWRFYHFVMQKFGGASTKSAVHSSLCKIDFIFIEGSMVTFICTAGGDIKKGPGVPRAVTVAIAN